MNNTVTYRQGLWFSSLIIWSLIFFHVLNQYKPYTFGNYDPGWMIFTTQSLVEDFDLDLRNQLDNNPEKIGGQISLGKNGEWYPLHEWLISLIAVPFYLLLGINGTLLCNMLMSFFTGFFTYKVCAEKYPPWIAAISTSLTFASSLLLHYSYSFSVDVLGVLFATMTLYYMQRHKPLVAGVLFSLTVFGRNQYLILLPAFLLYLVLDKENKERKVKTVLMFLLAGAPLGILFFLQNYLMYGSPFLAAYNFWTDMNPETGKLIIRSHSFDKPFVKGLSEILFSAKSGIFAGIPLLPLALILGAKNLHQKSRELSFFITISTLIMSIFFSLYSGFPGSIGNRYLIFLAPLSALLLCAAIERIRTPHPHPYPMERT
jgi:hypothetical protein